MSRCAENQNIQLDTLLKMCVVTHLNRILEYEVEGSTRELAEAHTEPEIGVTVRKTMEGALATKEVAEREVFVLTNEAEKFRDVHSRTILARNGMVDDLKSRPACGRRRADETEFEKGGAKTRLQLLQNGQQRYLAAAFGVQNEIAPLGAGLVKDRNYFSRRLEFSDGHLFCGLVQKCWWKMEARRRQFYTKRRFKW